MKYWHVSSSICLWKPQITGIFGCGYGGCPVAYEEDCYCVCDVLTVVDEAGCDIVEAAWF